MNQQTPGLLADIAGYLTNASNWIDFALIVALVLCVLQTRKTGKALATLSKAQEETPRQIEALIGNLETVRASVAKTLGDVTATVAEMNEATSKVEVVKEEVAFLTERLQRLLVKAQDTLDEVQQVTASAERIADRIAEITGIAKQVIAPPK